MKNRIITIILLNVICVCTNLYSQKLEAKNDSAQTIQDTSIVYEEVDQMPQFPGGLEAMANFMKKNVIYPIAEKKSGIAGTVYVKFIINRSGQLKNAIVIRGVEDGSGLNDEALRVIKSMPNWTIGYHNSKPANVEFIYPVKFELINK